MRAIIIGTIELLAFTGLLVTLMFAAALKAHILAMGNATFPSAQA